MEELERPDGQYSLEPSGNDGNHGDRENHGVQGTEAEMSLPACAEGIAQGTEERGEQQADMSEGLETQESLFGKEWSALAIDSIHPSSGEGESAPRPEMSTDFGSEIIDIDPRDFDNVIIDFIERPDFDFKNQCQKEWEEMPVEYVHALIETYMEFLRTLGASGGNEEEMNFILDHCMTGGKVNAELMMRYIDVMYDSLESRNRRKRRRRPFDDD